MVCFLKGDVLFLISVGANNRGTRYTIKFNLLQCND